MSGEILLKSGLEGKTVKIMPHEPVSYLRDTHQSHEM
jgi:hypothetical protein